MGRCNCNNSCTCSVKGDTTTTTVEGDGSAAHPYIVHALSSSTKVNVLDTGSVDMTETGTGTTADPYVISAVVKPSTDANNCMKLGTDGGVFAPCPTAPDGSETFVQGDGVTTTVDGTGTQADPYIVHGLGSTVVDGDTPISVSGSGTLADPYVVSLCISTDAGNTIHLGTDGCLFAAGGGAVTPGCGLTGTGTAADPLKTNTPQAWPFGCPEEAQGTPIYCSAVDGQLRTFPQKFNAEVGQAACTASPFPMPPGFTKRDIQSVSVTITNPSPCWQMRVLAMYKSSADVMAGTPTAVQVYQSVNGGPVALLQSAFASEIAGAGAEGDAQAGSLFHDESFIVPPGGSLTLVGTESLTTNPGGVNTNFIQGCIGITAIGWNI